MPEHGEVAGLLALMLLTDARRAARTGALGELIPLDEQDRSLWDKDAIREGVALITATLSQGSLGAYQLQAAIAACTTRLRAHKTQTGRRSWRCTASLQGMSDNPMVALNHAIAMAMVHGQAIGIERIETLGRDPRLTDHYRLDAVRAHLLERAGDHESAIARCRRAAERTTSIPERN